MTAFCKMISVRTILKILSGVIIVGVLSVSFSGFSISFSNLSKYLSHMYMMAHPVIGTCYELKMADNTTDAMLNDLTALLIPLKEELAVASYNAQNSIYIGDVESIVGENNYSLYDYVAVENEAETDGYISGDITVMNGDGYDESVRNLTENITAEGLSGAALVVQDNVTVSTASSGLVTPDMLLKKLYKKKSTNFLLKHFYIVDSTTSVKKSYFNVEAMLSRDYSISKSDDPQILIYHTHAASESYADGRSIVEAGDILADVLRKDFGYNVLHDKTKYDSVNGKIDRSLAYAKALPSVRSILAANPSVQVVIDLHRDGISSTDKATTVIDGKETARVMLFNGLSRNRTGDIRYLHNDNLFDNLSFSLQLKLEMMKQYPDLSKPIYLKGYRYNLHLKPRCLLIELGNQNNTYEEACNALGPFAKTLASVLQK